MSNASDFTTGGSTGSQCTCAFDQDTETLTSKFSSKSYSSLLEMIRIQMELQEKIGQSAGNRTNNCNISFEVFQFYQYALIPAILMIILAMCLKRRRTYLPYTCQGRPGLSDPMNILEDRSVRFSYALAFGISAQLCYDLLFYESSFYLAYQIGPPKKGYRYVHVLYRFGEVVLYGIILYPIFLTISQRSKLFYTLGTLYIWALTLVSLLNIILIQCPDLTAESHVLIGVNFLPSLVCMAGLSLIFPYRLFQKFITQKYSLRDKKEDIYQHEYVKDLINLRIAEDNTDDNKLKQLAKEAIKMIEYKRKDGFMYSPRIICTYTTVSIIMYMALYNIIKEVLYWIKLIRDTIKLMEDLLSKIGIGVEEDIKKFQEARVYINTFATCFYITIVIVIILNVTNIVLMILNYRSNILQMYKGDYSGLPHKKEATTEGTTFLIVSNLRYGGYQIAFTAIALIMQIVFLMGVSLGLSVVIFDPVTKTFRPWMLDMMEYYWPLPIISVIVIIGQYILVKFVFIPKELKNGIAIDNRNFYFNIGYFMFYFNVFWGLLSCVLRLLKAVVLTISFISRLDWSLFPKRFEFLDDGKHNIRVYVYTISATLAIFAGYFSYIGLLYIENAHSNPIMRTFLSLLMEATSKNSAYRAADAFTTKRTSICTENYDMPEKFGIDLEKSDGIVNWGRSASLISNRARFDSKNIFMIEAEKKSRKRARLRWFLAITLHNNPGLRPLRGKSLLRFKEIQRKKSSMISQGSRDSIASDLPFLRGSPRPSPRPSPLINLPSSEETEV